VIGSGRRVDPRCGEIGRLIASLGFDLLTGAGRGVMEAVSRAFHETSPRRGLVIGVVPAEVRGIELLEQRQPAAVEYGVAVGYPNDWVELAIYTHLPDSGRQGTLRSSRNHINVLSADAIVALPGEAGTASEIWLAGAYGVPIIAYGDHDPAMTRGVAIAATIDDVRRFLIHTLDDA
jgi:predicted Rossmann-fold nucleotide-binding protein